MKAFADGDGATACKQLTGDAKRQAVDFVSAQVPEFKATDCETALVKLTKNLGEDEKATLRDAKIASTTKNGNTATVKITGATNDAELTKGASGWLISGGLFGSDSSATSSAPSTPPPTSTPSTPPPTSPSPIEATRSRLEKAGFTVEDSVSADSNGVGDALTATKGSFQLEIAVYKDAAALAKAKTDFAALQKQHPQQVLFEVTGSTFYSSAAEQPIPQAQFKKAVAIATGP